MVCDLEYIPEHLHSNDKPTNNIFSVGEKLFYRCLPQDLSKPYNNISLRDISHNRNFCDDDLFGSDYVRYNVIAENDFQVYENYNHITLIIKNLNNNQTYYKLFSKKNHNEEVVNLELYLKHDPIPCMYPHSVFEITLNGEIVTKENYSNSLGKSNKFYSNLRSEIRQELTSLMLSGFIDDGIEIEEIQEP